MLVSGVESDKPDATMPLRYRLAVGQYASDIPSCLNGSVSSKICVYPENERIAENLLPAKGRPTATLYAMGFLKSTPGGSPIFQ